MARRFAALSERAATLPAWVWGVPPALVCFVTGLTDRLYIDIDNYWLGVVLNGMYADSICQFNHPLLGVLIGFLAELFPSADWFALLSRVLITAAVWWTGTLLAQCVPYGTKRWALYLALLLYLSCHTLYNKNYTIQSALFMAVSLATLALALRHPMGCAASWAAAFFLLAGCLWRTKSALLFIPFFVLDFLFCLTGRPSARRTLLRTLLPSAVCVMLLIGSHALFYAVPDYAQNQAYNTARTLLSDFPTQSWDAVCSELEPLGISENDYQCIRSSIFLDPEVLTLDKLEAAASVGSANRYSFDFQTLWDEFFSCFGESSLLRTTTFFVLTLQILLIAIPCGRRVRLETLLACGGAVLILVYFCILGRMRDRVILAVWFAVVSVTLPLLLTSLQSIHIKNKIVGRTICVLLGSLCLVAIMRWQPGKVQLACSARNAAWQDDDKTMYLWSSLLLSLQMTGTYMQEGKLPPTEYLYHNIPYGEWISGQSYLTDTLEELHFSNPFRALAERDDVCLISLRAEPIQSFLQEHYNAGLTLEQVGTIDVCFQGEVSVWQASD